MTITGTLAGPALGSRVFPSMGTMISVSVPAAVAADRLDAARDIVREVFDSLDRRFSLYKPESEASRINGGELKLREAGNEVRRMYELAVEWRLRTDGAFTPQRPDGALDLSGIVKGWAIQRAGESLLALGLTDWCLNAGGDVLCSGRPSDDGVWTVGIVDPFDRCSLLTAVPLDPAQGRAAVATSGIAERGEHIWAAGGGTEARAFGQVSVVAADIVTADVLATAVLAGGHRMLDAATSRWSVDVLASERGGNLLATPLFRAS